MKKKVNGHKPIQKDLKEVLNAMAHGLDDILNGKDCLPADRKNAFVLLVFPFGSSENNRANYISNAQRPDMIASMKEFVQRSEGEI